MGISRIFNKELSRRSLLGATALSAVTLTGCSKNDDKEILYYSSKNDPENNPATVEEVLYSSPCRSNCQSQCRLWAHKRGNRIVKTSFASNMPPSGKELRAGGTPSNPNDYYTIDNETAEKAYESYSRICLRGLSHVQRIYSKTRLLYPLKQTKERGDLTGFRRITWAEAIETVASKIAEHYDPLKWKGRRIGNIALTGNHGVLHGIGGANAIFGDSIDTSEIWFSADVSLPVGLSKVMGADTFPFRTGNEQIDMANAKNLILWGSNMAEAQLMGWKIVCNGRKEANKGGKIERVISIDVMANTTSAKSDYFYCIRPGSDTIVALAMISEVIRRGDLNDANIKGYDKAYMVKNTCAPFLVNKATGLYVREKDITGVTTANNYVMWDKTSGTVVYTVPTQVPPSTQTNPSNMTAAQFKATTPSGTYDFAIEGEHTLPNGITGVPAFEMLRQHVSQWQGDKVKEYTNISQDNINILVDMYLDGPSTIYCGFGASHHYNSHHFGYALATLGAVTGNIGREGASIGNFFLPTYQGMNTLPPGAGARNMRELGFHMYMPQQLANELRKPEPLPELPRMLMISIGNPVSNFVNSKLDAIDTVFNKKYMDFIVTIDQEMTDTALYSDIVLPAAHWFEADDYFFGYRTPFVVLQEKAIEPLGEAMSDANYYRMLSEKVDEKIPGVNVSKWFKLDFDPAKRFMTDKEHIALRMVDENIAGNRLTEKRLFGEKVIRKWDSKDPYIALRHPRADIDIFAPKQASGSGRLEFYSELTGGLPKVFIPFRNFHLELTPEKIKAEIMPTWVEPSEAWSGPTTRPELEALREKYPLIYMQEHTKWRVHTQWTQVPWLRELDPEPILKISPQDASKYGNIATGDMVRISNDRGSAAFRAIVTPALPEGMINVPKGWERKYYSQLSNGGAYNDMTNATYNTVGIDQTFYDARVKIEKIG